MESYKQKIEDVLTQALTEKTFSLEIIEKIKSLKDGFDASQVQIEHLTQSIKEKNSALDELRSTVDRLTTKVSGYEKRETELSTKERVAEKNLYELEFQKMRADEIKELFSVVFKNPIVRSNVYRNGNNGNDYVNETVSTITEQE